MSDKKRTTGLLQAFFKLAGNSTESGFTDSSTVGKERAVLIDEERATASFQGESGYSVGGEMGQRPREIFMSSGESALPLILIIKSCSHGIVKHPPSPPPSCSMQPSLVPEHRAAQRICPRLCFGACERVCGVVRMGRDGHASNFSLRIAEFAQSLSLMGGPQMLCISLRHR